MKPTGPTIVLASAACVLGIHAWISTASAEPAGDGDDRPVAAQERLRALRERNASAPAMDVAATENVQRRLSTLRTGAAAEQTSAASEPIRGSERNALLRARRAIAAGDAATATEALAAVAEDPHADPHARGDAALDLIELRLRGPIPAEIDERLIRIAGDVPALRPDVAGVEVRLLLRRVRSSGAADRSALWSAGLQSITSRHGRVSLRRGLQEDARLFLDDDAGPLLRTVLSDLMALVDNVDDFAMVLRMAHIAELHGGDPAEAKRTARLAVIAGLVKGDSPRVVAQSLAEYSRRMVAAPEGSVAVDPPMIEEPHGPPAGADAARQYPTIYTALARGDSTMAAELLAARPSGGAPPAAPSWQDIMLISAAAYGPQAAAEALHIAGEPSTTDDTRAEALRWRALPPDARAALRSQVQAESRRWRMSTLMWLRDALAAGDVAWASAALRWGLSSCADALTKERYVADAVAALRQAPASVGDKAAVLAGWVDAIANTSARYQLRVALAELYVDQQQPQQALDELAKAAAAAPPDAGIRPLVPHALALIRLRRFDEAMPLLERIETSRDPEHAPRAGFLIGWVHLQKGQNEHAHQAMRHVVQAYPSTEFAQRAEVLVARLHPKPQ